MSVNALYSYLSHEHFYFWENANLELPLEIAMFCLEINPYFAVKFRYENNLIISPTQHLCDCKLLRAAGDGVPFAAMIRERFSESRDI